MKLQMQCLEQWYIYRFAHTAIERKVRIDVQQYGVVRQESQHATRGGIPIGTRPPGHP